MRYARSFILAAFAVLLALAAAPQSAAAAPSTAAFRCPWCTTPTTCGVVDENTPISGCYINSSDVCRTLSGECIDSFALNAPGGREATLRKNNIEYHGVVKTEIWGIKMTLTAINDGLYAEWDCSGQISNLFTRRADGGWTAVDAASHHGRFTLAQLAAAPAATAMIP